MTEQLIRQTAEAFGLSVLKRIDTGNAQRHFATFELSGDVLSLNRAWDRLASAYRGPSFDRKLRVENPEHLDAGLPYIELSSVWCEVD